MLKIQLENEQEVWFPIVTCYTKLWRKIKLNKEIEERKQKIIVNLDTDQISDRRRWTKEDYQTYYHEKSCRKNTT